MTMARAAGRREQTMPRRPSGLIVPPGAGRHVPSPQEGTIHKVRSIVARPIGNAASGKIVGCELSFPDEAVGFDLNQEGLKRFIAKLIKIHQAMLPKAGQLGRIKSEK